jgi:hypothetical protein
MCPFTTSALGLLMEPGTFGPSCVHLRIPDRIFGAATPPRVQYELFFVVFRRIRMVAIIGIPFFERLGVLQMQE